MGFDFGSKNFCDIRPPNKKNPTRIFYHEHGNFMHPILKQIETELRKKTIKFDLNDPNQIEKLRNYEKTKIKSLKLDNMILTINE